MEGVIYETLQVFRVIVEKLYQMHIESSLFPATETCVLYIKTADFSPRWELI